MNRILKSGFLVAITLTIALNACNKRQEFQTETGTGTGQIEFQGKTYQLDAGDMTILLNEGYSPLHQINIWSKEQRRNFIVVLKSTSDKELLAGIYASKDIESAQFDAGDGTDGFNRNMSEAKMEVSKFGKRYNFVFTANTLTEDGQLAEYTVTWSGTLPVAAIRQFP
jgi:hypothetical protein